MCYRKSVSYRGTGIVAVSRATGFGGVADFIPELVFSPAAPFVYLLRAGISLG
jgi:hypothetical protein